MLAGPCLRTDGLFALVIASQRDKICKLESTVTMLTGLKDTPQRMTVLTAVWVSEANAPCKRCGKPNSSDDPPHIDESQQATAETMQTTRAWGAERFAVLDPACERLILE
jgi:hypothetical protein